MILRLPPRVRLAAFLALVMLPVAPRARGAEDTSRPDVEAARAADAIESSLDALDKSSNERRARASARCRDGFTMDGLMRHFDQGGLTADAGLDMAMIENHSLCYYQCRAYARKDVSLCSPMKAFKVNVGMAGGHLSGDLACADHNYDLHYVRALITRSPDFKQACRDTLLKGAVRSDDITPANVDSKCDMIRANADDPAALCAAAGRKPFHVAEKPQNASKCELFYRGIHGDAKACEGLPDDSHIKERCFGYAAFYKAFHAGDPKLCAGDPICRIFFGDGAEACESYARHIGGVVCRDAPEYDDPAAREAAAAETRREAARRKEIEAGPLPQLKARVDALALSGTDSARAAVLRRRYDEIVSRIAGAP